MGIAERRHSLRGGSPIRNILILACIGLAVFLALPIFNSLMLAGYLPYGPNIPEGKFPEPQTTIVLSVLGIMTVMALVGGYAINSGFKKLQGWLFTGILIAILWTIGIVLVNQI